MLSRPTTREFESLDRSLVRRERFGPASVGEERKGMEKERRERNEGKNEEGMMKYRRNVAETVLDNAIDSIETRLRLPHETETRLVKLITS